MNVIRKQVAAILSVIVLPLAAMAQFESAPAFPGAEGHGRFTTGARASSSPAIVHVTNLNDSGTGSFRAAVTSSKNRIVVFDVAGVIPLASDIVIKDNVTILGQTAPYPGITLRYYTIRPGANNIIRFIRFRRGQEKDINDGADATWQRQKTMMILDHCSFSWSIDEVASFYDNNNFTMQWCTLGESLCNAGHGKGAHGYGGIWGGKLASFHHNMICHVNNRGPRFNGARYQWADYTKNSMYSTYKWANTVMAENVDFRNCVMWDAPGTCYGGPGGGQINIVNNYYRGADNDRGSQERITLVTFGASGNSTPSDMTDLASRYYISGNTTETSSGVKTKNKDWKGVTYDITTYNLNGDIYCPDDKNWYVGVEHKSISGRSCVRIKLDEPAPKGYITTHSADVAFSKVLDYAGASLYRDEVDTRYMDEALDGYCTYAGSVTNKPGLIDVVSDCNGYTEKDFPKGSRPTGFDTDKDGIPDEWETANGLNPKSAADALTKSLDPKGYYLNIEVYANSLVEDIMKACRSDGDDSFEEYYPTVVKPTAIESVETDASAGCSYNILGQKVNDDYKGLVIRNGKKYINR